jgi:transketolase
VLSVHSIKPFDQEPVIRAARETGGIVTIEEHMIDGGLGSLVAETCLDTGAPPKGFSRIGIRGGFASVVGAQGYLRSRYGLDAAHIVTRAREVYQGKLPFVGAGADSR